MNTNRATIMKTSLLLATALLAPLLAEAGVNPQNGDFYISYNDIRQQSDGHELKLVRTYNSLSRGRGWFGYGWGTRYETRLELLSGGNAAIHEMGVGPRVVYRTKGDTEMRSSQCPRTLLMREGDGYHRETCDREDEYFDASGRLLRIDDRHGYRIDIVYEGSGKDAHASLIRDSAGQAIRLESDQQGRVVAAYAPEGNNTRVDYSYNQDHDLIKANIKNDQSYVYAYDSNHNMTRIVYIDQSSMDIAYVSPETGFVRSIADRNGMQADYSYRSDPADPLHTWTRVVVRMPQRAEQVQDYEFRRSRDALGDEQVTSLVTGDGSHRVERKYDDKQRLVLETSQGHRTEYVYHPRSGKLIMLLSDRQKRFYRYNDGGHLVQAADDQGQVIDLYYNDAQLISRLVEVNPGKSLRRELSFDYNALGKPVHIRMAGVGAVTVSYDGNGEIRNIDSSQGNAIAHQITEVFQDLMRAVSLKHG